MTSWAITAPPGSGKTLAAVDRIRDHLLRGRRVATNLDLHVEHLLPSRNRTSRIVRLPDRPCAADLVALGHGWDKKGEEENYGLIVLDELATWLNSRDWNDQGRKELFNWLVHHRKFRWHVIFIIQDIDSLDKQVRQSLIEYHVQVMRLDKVKIPFVSSLGQLLTLGFWDGYMPRIHVGVCRYIVGGGARPPITDRWIFRGVDLYDGYDTEQVISADYDRGIYSYLTPWHVKGRYEPPSAWQRFRAWVRGDRPARAVQPVPERLHPLLRLPPDVRWQAARSLISRGVL